MINEVNLESRKALNTLKAMNNYTGRIDSCFKKINVDNNYINYLDFIERLHPHNQSIYNYLSNKICLMYGDK
jgi:hypothetical protein